MKEFTQKITESVSKIDRRQIQIFLSLLTLGLLVLGAGAPGVTGGPGGW